MIDKNKQYKTRDGREVRIYAVDGRGEWPVHGAVRNEDGWHPVAFTRDGKGFPNMSDGVDLIEVKPRIKREVWLNVYDDPERAALAHSEKRSADLRADEGRIACVRLTIDCEEGTGL